MPASGRGPRRSRWPRSSPRKWCAGTRPSEPENVNPARTREREQQRERQGRQQPKQEPKQDQSQPQPGEPGAQGQSQGGQAPPPPGASQAGGARQQPSAAQAPPQSSGGSTAGMTPQQAEQLLGSLRELERLERQRARPAKVTSERKGKDW